MAKKKGAEAHNEAVRTATNIMGGGMLAAGGASSSVQAAKRQKEATRRATDNRLDAMANRTWASFSEDQARFSSRMEQHMLNRSKRMDRPEMQQHWRESSEHFGRRAQEDLQEIPKYLHSAHEHDKSAAHFTKVAKRAGRAKIGSAAAAGVGGAMIGSAFYTRYRKNKLERVKKPTRSRNGR